MAAKDVDQDLSQDFDNDCDAVFRKDDLLCVAVVLRSRKILFKSSEQQCTLSSTRQERSRAVPAPWKDF